MGETNKNEVIAGQITVIDFQQGDQIPDHFYSLVNWTPVLGALLVSGIYPLSKRNGLFGPYIPDNLEDLKFHGLDNHRLNTARYVYKEWMEAHSCKDKAIYPREFIEWFKANPPPGLDFNAKPVPRLSSVKFQESRSANPTLSKDVNFPVETSRIDEPWKIPAPGAPDANLDWYTPARYFARQILKEDPDLSRRTELATRVAAKLTEHQIFKRGGKKPLDSPTILKAFSNVREITEILDRNRKNKGK